MADYISITSFDSLAEAYLARTCLAGAGIGCIIDNEYQAGLQRTYGPVIDITLRVKAEDADTAVTVLTDAGILACPKCNGRDVGTTFGTKLRVLLAVLAANAVAGIRYRCGTCGHIW